MVPPLFGLASASSTEEAANARPQDQTPDDAQERATSGTRSHPALEMQASRTQDVGTHLAPARAG
jgi:hypothetical protein